MFGRRKPARTHRQQLLDELNESYGHLRLAAGHAVGGTAEHVTPAYDRARDVAMRRWGTTKDVFAPLYEQMREGAAHARKENYVPKKNKWPMVVGILATGAAVGAAGALVARHRRNTAQWDEYEPVPPLDDTAYGSDTAKDKVSKKAAAVADSVSNQAGKVAESLHGKGRTNSGTSQETGPFAGFNESDESRP